MAYNELTVFALKFTLIPEAVNEVRFPDSNKFVQPASEYKPTVSMIESKLPTTRGFVELFDGLLGIVLTNVGSDAVCVECS